MASSSNPAKSNKPFSYKEVCSVFLYSVYYYVTKHEQHLNHICK